MRVGGSLAPSVRSDVARASRLWAHASLEHDTTITDAHWREINREGGGYRGCDEHYNRKGHAVLMEDVVGDVRRLLGWKA